MAAPVPAVVGPRMLPQEVVSAFSAAALVHMLAATKEAAKEGGPPHANMNELCDLLVAAYTEAAARGSDLMWWMDKLREAVKHTVSAAADTTRGKKADLGAIDDLFSKLTKSIGERDKRAWARRMEGFTMSLTAVGVGHVAGGGAAAGGGAGGSAPSPRSPHGEAPATCSADAPASARWMSMYRAALAFWRIADKPSLEAARSMPAYTMFNVEVAHRQMLLRAAHAFCEEQAAALEAKHGKGASSLASHNCVRSTCVP